MLVQTLSLLVLMPNFNKYFVVTPEYETHSAGWYEPPEFGADCIEVEAVNKRDAKNVWSKINATGTVSCATREVSVV